jgi:hypothetical protein
MSVLAGLAALLTGLAYVALAILGARELVQARHARGRSPLGAAFVLMATICGPHHLVHAEHLLVGGAPVHGALLVALLAGMVPGVAFVALRAEALRGGPGERFVPGTPGALAVLPWLAAAAGGAVLGAAVRSALVDGASVAHAVPNLVLLVAYLVVGALILRTQVARRRAAGGWSLSGLAFGAVFPTCGLSHAVAGLTATPDWHLLTLDLVSVPLALWLLYVVRELHRRTMRDWNRRPLVGATGETARPSPWARAPAPS